MRVKFDCHGKCSKYDYPGEYPKYYINSKGHSLCPSCIDKNRVKVQLQEDRHWKIVDSTINYKDQDLTCNCCKNKIESAY